MTIALSALQTSLDATLAPTGTIGYVLLLAATTYTGTYTVNFTTDVITTSSNHNLLTGLRVRVSQSGGALATPLVTATDYFVIYVSATTFKLAASLALAIAGTAIDLTDAGSGTQTVTEQTLAASDINAPIASLISKELTSTNGYTRRAVTNLGTSGQVNSRAEKSLYAWTQIANATGAIVYRYYLTILGGSATIADTTGSPYDLTDNGSNITIAAGTSRGITMLLFASN